jgi:hypothetical protein
LRLAIWEHRMTWDASKWRLPLLITSLMLIWSALFSETFNRPFEWDDLHLIRHYSISELLSTLHGPIDPDGIETPALRPVATLFFHLQGTLLDEHMILQRALIVILMGGLLCSVGFLLREAGLCFRHIAIVLLLFVSSRVFASLVLFISMGSLILAYTFMVLAALFYLRWIKRGYGHLLALTFVFVALAVFTREEAYHLPLSLVLLWWLSAPQINYRRPLGATLGAVAIVAVQYVSRTAFVFDAPQPAMSIGALWLPFRSAWMPGGEFYIGSEDHLFHLMWIIFLLLLAAIFIRFSDKRRLQLVLGICVLGIVLCSPALAIQRSFGVALPSLALFTAIAVALDDVWNGFLYRRYGQGLSRLAILAACLVGLALGVTAGFRRSMYVAEALDQNAAGIVIADGEFVFDLYENVATIPETRRRTVLAHLKALGIHSREDVIKLTDRVASARAGKSDPPTLLPPMFYERYEYLSF